MIRRVTGAVTPDAARLDSGGTLLPCAMRVYLKVGSDAYTAYDISGGP